MAQAVDLEPDCRAISSARSHIGASIIFCFPRRSMFQPFWLTIRQANELGGHVRKGEESTIVVFWKVEDAKQSTEDLDTEKTNEKTRRRFLLRYYRVFNLEQCELPQACSTSFRRLKRTSTIRSKRRSGSSPAMPNPPEIQHAGSKAFYSAITDRITLPPRELFTSAEEYYATAAA